MKKDLILAAALMLSAIALPSCSNDDDEITSTTNSQAEQLTFSASATMECGDNGPSKAALQMNVYFSANEKANVKFFNASDNLLESATFTGDNSSAAATTNFTGTISSSVLNQAKTITATIPASAVNSNNVMVIPSTQTPVVGGFDPAAFIATGTVDKSTNKATFTSQVALVKITLAKIYGTITIKGTGICGPQNAKTDEITVNGISKNNTYYVAVWPGTYSDFTIKSGSANIKVGSVTFEAGKYYTANIPTSVTVTLNDLKMKYGYSNNAVVNNTSFYIPSSAQSIVFDYEENVSSPGDLVATVCDYVNIYKNGNSYYVLSDKNICMSGVLCYMFREYESLTNLQFKNFNIDAACNNTNGEHGLFGMFSCCTSLVTLNLSCFNIPDRIDMRYMFAEDSNLTTVFTGSGWNVTNSNTTCWIDHCNFNFISISN